MRNDEVVIALEAKSIQNFMLSSIEIFCSTSFESLGGLFNMLLFFSQVCVKGISDPSQIDIYAFVRYISVDVEPFGNQMTKIVTVSATSKIARLLAAGQLLL